MNTTKFIRTAKVGYIALSALLCLFGLLLIIFPDTAANVAGFICAILLIAFGIVKIIGYFSRDIYRLAFQYDLAFGLLMILLGAAMFANPGSLSSFICLSLGLYILTDSLFKIQIALDARRFGVRSWMFILISAVLAGIGGLLLVLRPTESIPVLVVMLGISLLFEGLLNLITVLTSVKVMRELRPDAIEVEYRECPSDGEGR